MPSDIHKYFKSILVAEKTNLQLEKEASLSIALVFPNSYEIAMSNLGFQSLYRLFNSYAGVRCERAFVYKSFPNTIRTIESAQQLSYFDVIAFSIAFELDYINVVKILKNSGLDNNTIDVVCEIIENLHKGIEMNSDEYKIVANSRQPN